MRVFLVNGNQKHRCEAYQTHAVVQGIKCPHCHADLKVRGTGKHISQDDRAYEADGYCVDCTRYVGVIRAEMDTLFGLREDEAVLKGRPRVYWGSGSTNEREAAQ